MNQRDRARRSKVVLLSSLLSICVLILGGAVMALWHKRSQSDQSHTTSVVSMTSGTGISSNVSSQSTIPALLQEINRRQNPASNVYLNAARAAQFASKLANANGAMTPIEFINTDYKYSNELLNSGKTEEALKEYRSIEQHLKTDAPAIWKKVGADVLLQEATAYLRIGELQNCCDNNNANSCLVPISGSGVHTRQEGSRQAIKCLTELLHMAPDNTAARWLLNMAYMTVGEYPQHVPSRWLIPLKTFGADTGLQKFYNAAPDMGLDYLGRAGSVSMEDFEGNGLLDLVISSVDFDGQLRYIHNNGDGTFTDRTKESGLLGEVGGLNIITTDYNNDGRPDIIVLRGGWMGPDGNYPLSLLRNDGNGHFTDVTIQAGLLSLGPTQTAVAFDYNGDGLLDLFVAYESVPGYPAPCKLFRNNGDGTFTDVSKQCGLNIVRLVKAAVSADFTHTGRPGLFLSCVDGSNILLRNDGPAGSDKSPTAPWKFTDVSHSAGIDNTTSTFSCFFFDYDNDGWPDIYVGGYKGSGRIEDVANDYLGLPTALPKAKLYHNNHDGTFTDVSKQAHLDKVILNMGLNYGDLDNDGWLDFYAGTGNPDLNMLIPKRMFRNHDGKYFDEVTTTGDFGHLQKGHGIAFGDLNNNGQQDVFIVLGGAYEADTAHDCLFVNPGNKNHWITLQLTGVKSNRIALGAEICVTVNTPQGERRIYKTVSTGGSFGNNPLRQEIGLGNATAIKQVTIHWPASGIQQTITNPGMDRFYKIREDDSHAVPWTVPIFKLPLGPHPPSPPTPSPASG